MSRVEAKVVCNKSIRDCNSCPAAGQLAFIGAVRQQMEDHDAGMRSLFREEMPMQRLPAKLSCTCFALPAATDKVSKLDAASTSNRAVSAGSLSVRV